jgi:hypothetical protein
VTLDGDFFAAFGAGFHVLQDRVGQERVGQFAKTKCLQRLGGRMRDGARGHQRNSQSPGLANAAIKESPKMN